MKSVATWWQAYLYLSICLSVYRDFYLAVHLMIYPSIFVSYYFIQFRAKDGMLSKDQKPVPVPALAIRMMTQQTQYFFGGTMWQTASQILAAKTDLYMF